MPPKKDVWLGEIIFNLPFHLLNFIYLVTNLLHFTNLHPLGDEGVCFLCQVSLSVFNFLLIKLLLYFIFFALIKFYIERLGGKKQK